MTGPTLARGVALALAIGIGPGAVPGGAQDRGPRTIVLWPEGVPGRRPGAGPQRLVDGRIHDVHDPTLTYYPPTSAAAGTAVIVCPGGGYARLAVSNEAGGITGRLRPHGVAVFVLTYRLAEYGHPAPLRDVLRAVRLVRSRATEFGVAADRIGVFGASAGGHLAASAATLFDEDEGRTGADLDRVSARPDFVALQYPVVSMRDPVAHAGSRRNLIGPDPPAALVDRLSIETRVDARTPPVFLVHTAEDRSVPMEHSLLLVQALRRAEVPVEAHFYERGPHGFGTRADLGTTSGWVDRFIDWLRARGLLAP